MEHNRFFRTWLICILTTILGQSSGMLIGVAFNTHVINDSRSISDDNRTKLCSLLKFVKLKILYVTSHAVNCRISNLFYRDIMYETK